MCFEFKEKYGIEDLKSIMTILRSDDGCPWDREQTHKSIRKNFIEETYEVAEAIDNEDPDLLREELGDVLLQIIFHSKMEEEKNSFCFDDVVNDICQKLIVRHPHIFSDTVAKTTDEVLNNWNSIKQKQKGQTTVTQTLESVPKQLPALMRTDKVQARADKAGFSYPNALMALDDLKSEVDELSSALNNDDKENIAEEIGDVIFSCVNVSRLYGLDAEELLSISCEKFIDRVRSVEELAAGAGKALNEISFDELNELWKKAKEKNSRE